MKKTLITTLMLAIIFSSYADGILDFEYFLEAGYMPMDKTLSNNTTLKVFDGSEYITFDGEIILLQHIFIGGYMRSQFYLKEDLATVPYYMDFTFRFGIKTENFEFGFRHTCLHPVLSSYVNRSTIQGAGYEEIYFKFKGKVSIF